jgi:signal transduction histidine kinase
VTVPFDRPLTRSFGRIDSRPRAIDAGIVAVLLALCVAPTVAHPQALAVMAFNFGLIVPLFWRRRHPGGVFALLSIIALAQWSVDVRAFGDIALLVALYTLAVVGPARRTLLAGAVLELGVVLATVRWSHGQSLKVFVGLTGLATAAGVLGTSVRNRRALLATLKERAARLELERDQQGRLAAAAERARIAREMHDIVAHNLSVMIALSDGASYAVRDAPGRAEAALATASRTGRQALAEMRGLLGVLRNETAAQDRSPQPGLAQIETLVEHVRLAGVPVRYEVIGRPRVLGEGLQLAVYRIVQESLTNTLKHAGPEANAVVSLSYAGDHLEVEVLDTGGPASAREDGRGLSGMRERAAVYGGVIEAGPAPRGGWHVRTVLMLTGIPEVVLAR